MPTTTDTLNETVKALDTTEIVNDVESTIATTIIKSPPSSPSASSTSTTTESSTSSVSTCNDPSDPTNPIVPLPNDELDILIKMERANK